MPSFARVGCYGEESSGTVEGALSRIGIYLTGNEHFEGMVEDKILISDLKFDTNSSFAGDLRILLLSTQFFLILNRYKLHKKYY